MSTKAYLMVRMHLDKSGEPTVNHVGIYGESPDTITHCIGKEIYACLLTSNGKDFEEAEQNLVDTVLGYDHFFLGKKILSGTENV